MFNFCNPKDKIRFYGNIVSTKPIYAGNRRVGYKIRIKTTIKTEGSNKWIPLYVTLADTSKNRRLYEWFVAENRSKPAPLFIEGKKRGQNMYNNEKSKFPEKSPIILQIFITRQYKIQLIKKIPDRYKQLLMYSRRIQKNEKNGIGLISQFDGKIVNDIFI